MGAGPLARLGSSARTGQVDNPAIPAPFLSPLCAQQLGQLGDIRRDPPRKLSLIWRRGRRSNGGPRVVRLLIGDIFGRCFVSVIEFFLPFSLFGRREASLLPWRNIRLRHLCARV